ncbi:hypothetical protein GGI07_005798 [Coemansia sp. Benny D115]|nr:hypothetical protein GGI07_005798 [Coemansia sp. Benny D115]
MSASLTPSAALESTTPRLLPQLAAAKDMSRQHTEASGVLERSPTLAFSDDDHSPVPSLTHANSRSSSASSSVNSALSPDELGMSTPRDLMPQLHNKPAPLEKNVASEARAPLKKRARESPEQHSTESDKTAAAATMACGETTADSTEYGASTKRRRNSSSSDNDNSTERTAAASCRRPKRLTGSTDFVKRFGLGDLYEQFVRPYAVPVSERQQGAAVRRPMPDLRAAYLGNVQGAAPLSRPAAVDLMALVMAPAKNELDRLELLPMASIRAAFSLKAAAGGGAQKRSRISLKCSTDSPLPAGSGQQHHGHGHGRPTRKVGSMIEGGALLLSAWRGFPHRPGRERREYGWGQLGLRDF